MLSKKIFFLISIFFISPTITGFAQIAQVHQTLKIIEDNYYDTTYNNKDWAQLKSTYLNLKAVSSKTSYQQINKLLVDIDDPAIQILDQKDFRTFFQEINGDEHIGIGLPELFSVDVDKTTRNIIVVMPVLNSPADKAGLKANDIILSANGQLLNGMSLHEAMFFMRGKIGESVDLKIKRSDKIFEVTLNFAKIKPPHYPHYRIIKYKKKRTGLIWIPQFTEGTGLRVLQIYNELQQKGIDNIILDLRNNPGGYISEARIVAGIFLGERPLARNLIKTSAIKMFNSVGKQQCDLNLVVLINESTASAAELLASSLDHYHRATLVGTTTNKKGLIFSFFSLIDDSAIILPIGRLTTLDDIDIETQGIEPQIYIRSKKTFRLESNFKKDKQLKAALNILINKTN